jgi:hypothetical protein
MRKRATYFTVVSFLVWVPQLSVFRLWLIGASEQARPSQQGRYILFKRLQISRKRLPAGAEHKIPAGGQFRQQRPDSLAEPAFQRIALDRVLCDTLTDHEPDA